MKALVSLVVGVVALSSPALQAQKDPLIGTWVLNVAKSSYSPGPAPKEQMSVYEAAGDGVKVTVTSTSADGKKTSYSYTGNFDGKDAKVTGNAEWDTVAMKRLAADRVEFTRKKGGKVVQTATMVIAKDGKTRTVTTTGVNAKGQKVKNVAVYDRRGSGT
jgi:outer membrane lipoprotein-sorting protein